MGPESTKRKEGGGRFAIWLIRTIGLKLGRPVARSLLYPITLYFYFRRQFERRASYEFLTRVFGRPAGAVEVMRHIHRFAATILDRIFLLAGDFSRFDVHIHGIDELISRIRPDKGVLLLGSHVGSFEVLRVAAAERRDADLCVVLDRQQTPAMTQLLDAINPEIGRSVIDASGDPTDLLLALGEAIAKGRAVAMLADRTHAHETSALVDFLGAPAAFPVAPFRIASVLQVPVVLCFGMYRGGNRYDLHFELFAERLALPRRGAEAEVRSVVQRYVARIEHYVRDDPFNWFNWYDIWDRGDRQPADPGQAISEESCLTPIGKGQTSPG
ncbi:MAG TPA: acyltransferase [Rhodanobacteraceae bacterium]|nr:acyltransferase [Rhodanobacteraceae bacterium]